MLLRTSYHSRGMDTNAGAKVSTPLELSHPSFAELDLRSVRRLTIRFVSCDRFSAASYIGGSSASLLLQRKNAASG
ncbi:MAG: hypothetical protein IJY93_05855 [Clostridia bacterium]|nr:hypothetical protein [Clostridia bacterium]